MMLANCLNQLEPPQANPLTKNEIKKPAFGRFFVTFKIHRKDDV